MQCSHGGCASIATHLSKPVDLPEVAVCPAHLRALPATERGAFVPAPLDAEARAAVVAERDAAREARIAAAPARQAALRAETYARLDAAEQAEVAARTSKEG